jgi:two-component system, chemotaxis family, protein-glutamate methylesterase/glutaminase
MAVKTIRGGPPSCQVVVVVASMGGLTPLLALLAPIPGWYPVPIVVILHRRQSEDATRLQRLVQSHTAMPVRDATDGRHPLRPGVTLVPPDRIATIDEALRISLSVRADNNHGGDLTLVSAAGSLGAATLAVVLSGLQQDGTAGARAIKGRGGIVLAQDPRTATAPSMPSSAIATGCVDHVLTMNRMASAVLALTLAPGGAELLAVSIPHWASSGL